jgi:hypothetical protein
MSWECHTCGAKNTDDTSLRCYCGQDKSNDRTQVEKKSKNNKLRIVSWLGEIISICSAIFCFLGYSMAASFSVAAPEQKSHWVSVALAYGIGATVSLIMLLVFAVGMFTYRKKPIFKI